MEDSIFIFLHLKEEHYMDFLYLISIHLLLVKCALSCEV